MWLSDHEKPAILLLLGAITLLPPAIFWYWRIRRKDRDERLILLPGLIFLSLAVIMCVHWMPEPWASSPMTHSFFAFLVGIVWIRFAWRHPRSSASFKREHNLGATYPKWRAPFQKGPFFDRPIPKAYYSIGTLVFTLLFGAIFPALALAIAAKLGLDWSGRGDFLLILLGAYFIWPILNGPWMRISVPQALLRERKRIAEVYRHKLKKRTFNRQRWDRWVERAYRQAKRMKGMED